MNLTGPDLGLLLVRLIGGGIFFAHGAQKAFGWWKGPGIAGWRNAIRAMGFRPVAFWGLVSLAAELVGGLALMTGFLTPLAAAALVGQAVVMVFRAHWSKGFWNRDGGFEFPLALSMAPLMVVLAGPGAISLDALIGLDLATAPRIVLAVIGGLVGLATLAYRRPASATTPPPPGQRRPQR